MGCVLGGNRHTRDHRRRRGLRQSGGGASRCGAFSLHATKTMGMGEGGFAVSGDADWIERVRCLSNFGIDPGDFKVHQAGSNAKLSEYHAAVGIAALARWPERAALRSALAT